MRVLIVEDDSDIASNLYDYLENRGYHVDAAENGILGLHLALSNDYDSILLDLSLPGMDGLTLCHKLREDAKRDIPILMLTARDQLDDKLRGFDAGTDDYIVKPFSLSEVEARIKALDKRYNYRLTRKELIVGDIKFNLENYTVTRKGINIKLPRKCLQLLKILMSNTNKVFTHNELETTIWSEEIDNGDTLRTHMHILRNALTQKDEPDPIKTIHGIGYQLIS